jgi:predicted O-methyltransferase YrrM
MKHESQSSERLRRARELQRTFRRDPVGGKLTALKRLFFRLTASAFDRQAKAVEALLDVVEDLAAEKAGGVAWPAAGAAASAGRPVPEMPLAEGSPRSLPVIVDVGAEMLMPEKVLLYALVFGLKPQRCLEIGTFRGGSAAVICAAMDDNGFGRLVCVDPEPRIPPEVSERIAPRATILQGPSPEVLDEARKAAGGPFAFALIDGDHSTAGVLRDVEGVLDQVVGGAYLLFHDCHFAEVAAAVDESLRRHPRKLVDCGVLSVTAKPTTTEGGGEVVWGGLRLLRHLGR